MNRLIRLNDLKHAAKEAYKKYHDKSKGEVDPRLGDVDKKKFAIAIMTGNGETISFGDCETAFPLTNLMRIPTALLLLQQTSVKDLVEKAGLKGVKDGKSKKKTSSDSAAEISGRRQMLKEIPVNLLNMRAVSAIEPKGNPEGKMNMIVENITALAGSEPLFDDDLCKTMETQADPVAIDDILSKADYKLYDDTKDTIDLTIRMESLKLNTLQLVQLGATIAFDGRNPVSDAQVFDSKLSERIVAMMAGFGPSQGRNTAWLIRSGVPAMAGFGGGVLAVVPGAMAIAAYSPLLSSAGASRNALHAISYITNELDINIFSSMPVTIE